MHYILARQKPSRISWFLRTFSSRKISWFTVWEGDATSCHGTWVGVKSKGFRVRGAMHARTTWRCIASTSNSSLIWKSSKRRNRLKMLSKKYEVRTPPESKLVEQNLTFTSVVNEVDSFYVMFWWNLSQVNSCITYQVKVNCGILRNTLKC